MIAGSLVSCNKGGEDLWDNVDMIAVQTSKEKWGFLNNKGEIVLEDEFKEAPTVVYNGTFITQEKGKYVVNKLNGEKYDVLGELEGLKSVGLLKEGLVPATLPNQRIAIFNDKGEKQFELTPVGGKEVTEVFPAYFEGLLAFETEEGKYGFFDTKGNVAIKPTYDVAFPFSNGLAVAGKSNKDKERMEYSVIDKDGNVVFDIKDGQQPNSMFSHGYLIVRDDDRTVLYDKKGEILKFSSKLSRITDTNGKYIIYKNDDGEYGVVDMKEEQVIRAKYSYITFDGDKFLAEKDDEYMLLNSKGDTEATFDYDDVRKLGKFGYIARDKKVWCLVDDEGERIGKEDFENISLEFCPSGNVTSDYFDAKAVASKIVSMIDENGVSGYKFGSTGQQIFSGERAQDYTYRSEVTLPNCEIEGFRYKIDGSGLFTESIASGDWDYYNYSYSYHWNSGAKLGAVNLKLNAQSEFGKAGFDAIVKELQSKNYKTDKTGYMGGDCAAMLSKGKTTVFVSAAEKGDSASIIVLDTSNPDIKRYLDYFSNNITKDNSGSAVEETTEPDYIEEVAVDSPAW